MENVVNAEVKYMEVLIIYKKPTIYDIMIDENKNRGKGYAFNGRK